tara:strand:- start:1319 stop:1828 length:510 start_codon:yes stop_codon:yes gene_type:complete
MDEFRRYKQLKEQINALDQKLKRVEKDRNRMAGEIFAGGVTANEQLNERNQPLVLTSPEASGTAVPILPQISGAGVLNPVGPEQTARVYNSQQYRDLLNSSRRFKEDDFLIGEKFRKNEMARQNEMLQRRQRVATQATLLQQGQLGAQSMAQQSMGNIGSVLASTPTYQ